VAKRSPLWLWGGTITSRASGNGELRLWGLYHHEPLNLHPHLLGDKIHEKAMADELGDYSFLWRLFMELGDLCFVRDEFCGRILGLDKEKRKE